MSKTHTSNAETVSDSEADTFDVVEMELTVDDQFYYVSKESGDTFETLPYIMHTALYYALGMLPSQFRSLTNTDQYKEHYEASGMAQDIYIHPATALTTAESTTRRFSCKGDAYRRDTEPENKNSKETGHQKYLNPGTTFRTFIRVDPTSDTTAADVIAEIPPHIRTGKKMTSTRVECHQHTATKQTGEFTLGQPIACPDFDMHDFDTYKNIDKEQLNVDLLQRAIMTGEYITVEPVKSPVEGMNETVSLPTQTSFLGY